MIHLSLSVFRRASHGDDALDFLFSPQTCLRNSLSPLFFFLILAAFSLGESVYIFGERSILPVFSFRLELTKYLIPFSCVNLSLSF